MDVLPVDPEYADQAAFDAELEARWAGLDAAGWVRWAEEWAALVGPDVFDPYPEGRLSRVEALEWELWGAEEQDEAERALLELDAPAWMTLPPGGELATALEGVRCSTTSPVGLIEVMKAADRLTAWSQSIRVEAIAAFTRQRRAEAAAIGWVRGVDEVTGRPMDPERSAACEVAAALRLSPATVHSHIATAERLTGPLQDTLSALRCGALTLSKALCITEAATALAASSPTNPADPADPANPANLADSVDSVDSVVVARQQWVQARVLTRAPGQTQTQLRAALRRAVARVDTRNHAERHRGAVGDRACRKHQLADGMAGIWFTHRADLIEKAWTVIESLTDLTKTPTDAGDAGDAAAGAAGDAAGDAGADARTAEQRRADVVVDVFAAILDRGTDWLDRPLPARQRRRPHIEVLIPATTLLGLDDQPAELTGYGPIPADLARTIATDGTWRRLLTDPATGVVLEAATTRHDPAAQVSQTLIARDRTCRFIGCTRPAHQCDRDHGVPFAESGETSLGDLRMHCESHHLVKDDHHARWRIDNRPDGTTVYTTPTGHQYTTHPPQVGPIPEEPLPPSDPDPPDPPPF